MLNVEGEPVESAAYSLRIADASLASTMSSSLISPRLCSIGSVVEGEVVTGEDVVEAEVVVDAVVLAEAFVEEEVVVVTAVVGAVF